MKKKQYKYSDFLAEFTPRLVDVNGDDLQTGWYRLMETEKDRVSRYQAQGFTIATIWQEGDGQTEETVTFEFENSREHPFVTGYFILIPVKDEYKGMRTRKEILETKKDCQLAIDEYADMGTNGEEGEAHIYEGWVEALDYVLGKTSKNPEFPVEDEDGETPASVLRSSPELQSLFNRIADAVLYNNFPRNLNGTFAHAELTDAEYPDEEDGESYEYYLLNIKYGQQDDTTSVTYQCGVTVRKDIVEQWLKGDKKELPKFRIE